MILDSSAIVAIMRVDSEAEVFAHAIGRAATVGLWAATFLETALVLGAAEDLRLDELVAR